MDGRVDVSVCTNPLRRRRKGLHGGEMKPSRVLKRYPSGCLVALLVLVLVVPVRASVGALRHGLGAVAGPRVRGAVLQGEWDLPLRVSLEMPEVVDQGVEQSCAYWATAYYLGGKMSPTFLAALVGGCERGHAKPQWMGTILKGEMVGALPVERIPGDPWQCVEVTSLDLVESVEYRAESFTQLDTDVENLKRYLVTGKPFIAVVPVHDNWLAGEWTHVLGWRIDVPRPGSMYFGCHAVVVCGYEQDRKAFRFVNSWGEWGNKGYAWMTYGYVEGYLIEAWGMNNEVSSK